MRFSRIAPSLLPVVFLAAGPLLAADQPAAEKLPVATPALIETLPVGTGQSIMINIEEVRMPPSFYPFTTSDGKPVTVTMHELKLTTGDPNGERTDFASANHTIAQSKVPVPVFFRNLTHFKLRVRLQQPTAPPDATQKDKMQYCTPTCKLDPDVYVKGLCDEVDISGSTCKPKASVMAVCGTEECNALRKECKAADCRVDLYKALDTCACSVSKVLLPSTFPILQDHSEWKNLQGTARYVEKPGGGYILETHGLWPAAALSSAAINVPGGATMVVKPVSPMATFDYPTALFDASLFSRKDGITTKGDQYRFLIEEDPAPPTIGSIVPNDPVTKQPILIYARALPPVVVSVGDPPTLLPNVSSGSPMRVVVVPLDDTGVANWRYLNPRNPACINCAPGGQPLPGTELPAGVVFHNRTQDRAFLISMTLPANVATNAVEEAFRCTPGQPCKITRSVAPQNTELFDASLLALFKNSLIRFDVSLFGETTTLGYPAAYLSLNNPFDEITKLAERPSSTNFKTKLSLSGRVDPQIRIVPTAVKDAIEGALLCVPNGFGTDYKPNTEPSLCAKNSYDHGSTQAYRGSGSLNLTANLSDRADGSVTLNFRDGNLGADIDKTALSEYNVTIYGTNGLSLKFGKTDYLTPSSGIALSESGEGFLYSWRYFGLGHVVRRESDAGIPLQTNRDKKDWFLQARSLPLLQGWREEVARDASRMSADASATAPRTSLIKRALTMFRSVDLVVVRGEDKKRELPSTYVTGGGEIFFSKPASSPTQDDKGGTLLHNIFGGSFAAYQSRRTVDPQFDPVTNQPRCKANVTPVPDPFCDGRGKVWLFTLNWTPSMSIAGGTNVATTPHTFSFAVGKGTGNKPGTRVDEGFIGDSAGFSPDRLFLKTFIPKMNSKDVPYEAVGLANKRYMAMTYTNSEFSLFDLVASALGVHNDVNSRSSVIALRDYKLLYAESGARAAAREINVAFNIEVPKGVTFTFDMNRLDPSGAFKDRIKRSAWSFGANVTLSL